MRGILTSNLNLCVIFLSDSLRFETKFVDAEIYLDNEFGEFRL